MEMFAIYGNGVIMGFEFGSQKQTAAPFAACFFVSRYVDDPAAGAWVSPASSMVHYRLVHIFMTSAPPHRII